MMPSSQLHHKLGLIWFSTIDNQSFQTFAEMTGKNVLKNVRKKVHLAR